MQNKTDYNLRQRSEGRTLSKEKPIPVSTQDASVDLNTLTMDRKLDTIMEQLCSLQSVPTQLAAMEAEIKSMRGAVVDMAESVAFMENEVESVKETLKEKAEKKELELLQQKLTEVEKFSKQKIEDLENRSRRLNLVLHGIPEGSEGELSCELFIKNDILKSLMGFPENSIEIERAHRSPSGPPRQNNMKPRPIHVRFLRFSDREAVLKAAPLKLKGTTFKGQKIFITDDVSPSVRENRKVLRQHLHELKKRSDVNYAFIPWVVPACLIIVKHDGSRQKLTEGDMELLQ